MSGIEFREKAKELFVGDYSLKERFLTAFLPAFVLSFILFLFGPLDLCRRTEAYTGYSVPVVFPACLKIWGLVFAGSFIVSWLIGGKMHAWLSSLMIGLAAAFYIQRACLNMDLNEQVYTDVWWQDYHTSGFLNLFLFLLIVMLPFVIHFFSHKVWRRFAAGLAVLLLGLMLIPFGKMISDAYPDRAADQTRSEISYSEEEPIDPDVLQKLISYSCYQYFPVIMKAPFHVDIGSLKNPNVFPEEDKQMDQSGMLRSPRAFHSSCSSFTRG